MYPKKILTELKKRGIEIGDRIKVSKENEIFEGVLMPRIEMGDENSLILKLGSGYNIGVKFDNKTEIKRLGKGKKLGVIPKLKIKRVKKLPDVSIVATGGTIGTHVDYKTGGVFMCRSPEEILSTTPEIGEIVSISFRHGNPSFPQWSFGTYSKDDKPQEFESFRVKGIKTPSGIVVSLDDESGTVLVKTPSGVQLTLDDENDKVNITNSSGVQLDITDGDLKVGKSSLEYSVKGEELVDQLNDHIDAWLENSPQVVSSSGILNPAILASLAEWKLKLTQIYTKYST